MSSPHSHDNPFAHLEPVTPADRYNEVMGERLKSAHKLGAQIEENLEQLKIVPELVGRIATHGPQIAQALLSKPNPIEPFSVYTTSADHEHTYHGLGEHLRRGKRGLRHPFKGEPIPPPFSQGDTNAHIYKDLVGKDRPRGWLQGLAFPEHDLASPLARFVMLDTQGDIYDVKDIDVVGNAEKGGRKILDKRRVALGDHANGSNLWRYLPATKLASVASGIEAHPKNKAALAQKSGEFFGPGWQKQQDILALIEAWPANLRGHIMNQLMGSGSILSVQAEVDHLTAIGYGLGKIATDSGKYRSTAPPPADI